jgi:hypothetical protein
MARPNSFPKGTPLAYCADLFGGVLAFGRAIGRQPCQLYRWKYMGGMIPSVAQTDAMIAAKRLGLEIDPARLVYLPPGFDGADGFPPNPDDALTQSVGSVG